MDSKKTGIERAVEAVGSQAALGDALDPSVVQQTVWKWVERGYAPTSRAKQIRAVALTHGIDIRVADLVKDEVRELMEG